LMARAYIARRTLEETFPEMSKRSTEMLNRDSLAVPDRDFKMTFWEWNLENPAASHDLAEYADGKIVFR